MTRMRCVPIRFVVIVILLCTAFIPVIAFASQDDLPEASPITDPDGIETHDGELQAFAQIWLTSYIYKDGNLYSPPANTFCATFTDTTTGTDVFPSLCSNGYSISSLFDATPGHTYDLQISTNTTGFNACVNDEYVDQGTQNYYYLIYVDDSRCPALPATMTPTSTATATITPTLEDGVTPTITATATETATPSPTTTPGPTNKWIQAWVYQGSSQNYVSLDGSICFQFNDTTTEPYQQVFEDCLVGDSFAHYESLLWNHTYDLSISSNTSTHEACIDRSVTSPTSFIYYIRIDGGDCNPNYGYRTIGVSAFDQYGEQFQPGNDTYCFTITDDQTGSIVFGETCSYQGEGGGDIGWWGFREINITHTFSVNTTKNTTGCDLAYTKNDIADWTATFTCGPTIYISDIEPSCAIDGQSVNFTVEIVGPLDGYEINIYGAYFISQYPFFVLAADSYTPIATGQTSYIVNVPINTGALGKSILFLANVVDSSQDVVGADFDIGTLQCDVIDLTATSISATATQAFSATATAAIEATGTTSAGATATQASANATATQAFSATATAAIEATATTSAGATATQASVNATATEGFLATLTATAATSTATVTVTPSATTTVTVTVTTTATSTSTSTATVTVTPSATTTVTPTGTVTVTATTTGTVTATATASSTATGTVTATPATTSTPSATATGTADIDQLVIAAVTLNLQSGESWLGKLARFVSGGQPPYFFTMGTPPTQGTAGVDASGVAMYTANDDAQGTDHFTFIVTDSASLGSAAVATGEVIIHFPGDTTTPGASTPPVQGPTSTIQPGITPPNSGTGGAPSQPSGAPSQPTGQGSVSQPGTNQGLNISGLPKTGTSQRARIMEPAITVPLLLGILLLAASAMTASSGPRSRARRRRG